MTRIIGATADDVRFMCRALTLASRGKHTHPNPAVGAVIVRNNAIVGEGWHRGVGSPHAEAVALADALAKNPTGLRGATIYTTLEPCSHYVRADGTNRIPCVLRCVEAGITRVVSAMQDPDTQVSGQGFAALRAAGVVVTVGVEELQARAQILPYIHHRQTGLSYITHKAAMTLDGKIASVSGDSRWVTGEKARLYVHRLRNRVDAVVVGVGTILSDDPQLTTRLAGVRNVHDPIRVIIDSALRTPLTARVAQPGTIVLTIIEDSLQKKALAERGVEVCTLPADETGRVDVTAVVQFMANRGALDVLLESGGALAASFWKAGLVNHALFFIAPKVIGGSAAPTPIDGTGIASRMAEAVQLGKLRMRRFGIDIALEGEVIG